MYGFFSFIGKILDNSIRFSKILDNSIGFVHRS